MAREWYTASPFGIPDYMGEPVPEIDREIPSAYMSIEERWREVREPCRKRCWNKRTCEGCGVEFCLLWRWYVGPGGVAFCSRPCLVRVMFRPQGCHPKLAGRGVVLTKCACCERQFAKGWKWQHGRECSARCHAVRRWDIHWRRMVAQWPSTFGLKANHSAADRVRAVAAYLHQQKEREREKACLRLSKEALRAARQFLRNGSPEALQSRLKELQQAISTPG